MKIYAVNGSPRKNWNTAALLDEALAGAASLGAQTERIDLYDLDYKGCSSCFSCKRKGGSSYGKCAMRDGLTPLLSEIEEADAVIFGSPIYFGNVTAGMRGFLERLLFAHHTYDKEGTSLFPKQIKTAFIYTMNVTDEEMVKYGYLLNLKGMDSAISHHLGPLKVLYSNDTFQFDDYSKYVSPIFDPAHKAEVRSAEFPIDLARAHDLGEWCANGDAE